jgi:hypothetical protein
MRSYSHPGPGGSVEGVGKSGHRGRRVTYQEPCTGMWHFHSPVDRKPRSSLFLVLWLPASASHWLQPAGNGGQEGGDLLCPRQPSQGSEMGKGNEEILPIGDQETEGKMRTQ